MDGAKLQYETLQFSKTMVPSQVCKSITAPPKILDIPPHMMDKFEYGVRPNPGKAMLFQEFSTKIQNFEVIFTSYKIQNPNLTLPLRDRVHSKRIH